MNNLKQRYYDAEKALIFDQYLIGCLSVYCDSDTWNKAIAKADELVGKADIKDDQAVLVNSDAYEKQLQNQSGVNDPTWD